MELIDLALTRAGVDSLAEFQRREGLPPTGSPDALTWQALLPWLTGYRLYAAVPGDSFTRIAARFGTTVSAIAAAHPNIDPLQLRVGQYLTVPLGFPVVSRDMPTTYTALGLYLQGLQKRYPFLTVNAFGESDYGRKLWQVALGRGERRVLYNASHHANEWITTPLLLLFLEDYARAVAENGTIFGFRARELYERTVLHLVPMVNPDGVELVTGGLQQTDPGYAAARQMAARYPRIPFPDGWKANLRGVDLNLNYPARWEEARRIKFALGYDEPGPRDFVGQRPLDQAESLAMAELTQRLQPVLTLSYHTQGEVIYWKFLDLEPTGARQLGEDFAAVSGYTLEDVPYASGFAGYKDWYIQTFDRPGYTIEAGLGENPLPLEQLEQIYSRNLGILSLGLAYAGQLPSP